MNEELFRLMELSQQGFCCSQAVVQMGLDAMGKTDPDLIRAMGGLCGGMRTGGKVCGALSGAACLISLYLGKGSPDEVESEDAKRIISAFVGWFENEFGEKYGGTDCLTILEGKPESRPNRCPQIILGVFLKARELLRASGISMSGRVEEE